MRQFLTWRFWFALAGVAGLFAVLFLSVGSDDRPDLGLALPMREERTIDLVARVATAIPSSGFAITAGTARGDLRLDLGDQRTLHIHDGTLGSDRCRLMSEPGACVVLADLLGDAVVWFTLVPRAQGDTVALPPIRDFPRSGWARLDTGWELPLARTVTRICDDDTSSLRDFVTRHGEGSTTTVDIAQGRITRVTCAVRRRDRRDRGLDRRGLCARRHEIRTRSARLPRRSLAP